MDWKTLVDQLVRARSAPVSSAAAQRAKNSSKLEAIGSLKDDLQALGAALKELSASNAMAVRTAKIADGDGNWSATAAPGTQSGDYRFNVTKVATKSQLTGTANLAAPLSSSSDVSGVILSQMRTALPVTAGYFSVNGTSIQVNKEDSLEALFARISQQTAGAVSAAYDPASDAIELTSDEPIVLGSAADTSNLLNALKLFNGASGSTEVRSRGALAVLQTSVPLEQAGLKLPVTNVDAQGNGSFWINGTEIEFNTKSDTLQTLLARINASSAGVAASYESVSGRLNLTNKVTGNLGLAVRENAGGLLESLGFNGSASLQLGENAEFTINGGSAIVSTSNVLTPQITGIAGLTVNAGGIAAKTITVGDDQAAMRSKLEEFISKYNKVQSFIEEQTKISVDANGKVATGSLASERELRAIGSGLRAIVFGTLPSATGAVKRLADIGIDFKSGSSQLEIKNPTLLTRALADNSGDVASLFAESSGGLATKVDAYISKAVGSGGALTTTSEALSRQNTDLGNQITRLNRELEKERARLTESFIQMERMQSTLQNQMRSLENAFSSFFKKNSS